MKITRYTSLGALFLYLGLPLLGMALYSFSTSWNKSILPEGLTLKWVIGLFQDGTFLLAFGRSLLLSSVSVLVSIMFIVPAICVIVLYLPKQEKWIKSIIVLIYSFPGIILSVGLLKFYSGSFMPLIVVIGGVYCVIILPYLYQGIKNSLLTVNGRTLMDTAELLGASKWYAFRKILLPSIYPGLFVATLLSFSILFGEFVLINLIVGSKYETLQIYLMEQLQTSGHVASAISFVYVVLMACLTFIVMKFSANKGVVRKDERSKVTVDSKKLFKENGAKQH
ncbi:ABC transporter permease [Rummeliibacillus sp. SL167]|uniref:ABC transporter permease n=1 Tax=Rummeliibacillus sp. SL167 TaxID=2579792 RepID=UPI0011B42B1E|nr:ABC transporter permease subunit [Rummeliibacillus sp. SL167]